MEAFRGTEPGANPWRLTKLYSDAKQSYRHAIPESTADDIPELQSANRKFRMQKDRLIAWGLEWTDQSDSSPENPIGETVEKAGLTEVVSSVMENIIGMIDEVEKLRLRIKPPQAHTAYPLEKAKWDTSDIDHYKDLIRDITSAIDLLCDLSKSRRSASRTDISHPSDKKIRGENGLMSDYEASKASEELAKALQSQEDPSSVTAQKINRSLLIMPEEASPPYDSFGMPCPVQIVGRMRMKEMRRDFKGNEHLESTVPVLVEYARFDPIYQNDNLPLNFTRLNQLSNILATAVSNRPSPLLNFVGYFEDPNLPRIGLVYQLPQWANLVSTSQPASVMRPESLHSLLQAASQAKPTPAAPVVNPALEDRFVLASELVSGFSHLLDRGYSHKDVNSTSITFFPGPGNQPMTAAACTGINYVIRKPVICAFDLFSEYDIDRERENLHQNIYRHPDDPRINGPNANEEYHPRFDMYSLGLLLLEIGLWAPLAKMFKVKYSLRDFGLRLRKIWIPRLASECGSVYMRAVQELMDLSNRDFVNEATRKDCFSRISGRLYKCCLLDEGELDSIPADYTPPEEPKMYTYTLSDKFPVHEPENLDEDIYRSSGLPAERPTSAPFEIEPAGPLAKTPPPGAWPEVPIFPDFEITSLGSGSIVKRAFRPIRYLFPQCAVLRAVCKEAYRIERRLCKIGEKVLDPQESASISLDGFGETENVAKPTFCVMCSSTSKFYKAVKKNLAFDNNVFDLIIFKGAISRSKALSSTVARRSTRGAENLPAKNPDHHVRPVCGASIGAWKDCEHLAPVSFGGVIMVDGEPYGMSVHHMLEAPDCDSDDEEDIEDEQLSSFGEVAAQRSSARQQSVDTLTDFDAPEDDDDDTLSLGDSDVESITFSDIEDEEAEDYDDTSYATTPDAPSYPPLFYCEGDTAGISLGSGAEITVTQPALDDVDDEFFPVEEDKDDDHLSSHSLGHIHASSGIRRLTHNGVDHEIDWALLRLDKERLQPHNVVPGGRRHCTTITARTHPVTRRNALQPSTVSTPPLLEPVCRKPYPPEEDLYPTTILHSDDLSERAVHSVGRTSGLATGQISSYMEFVKMSGRRTWSESWTVRSERGEPPAADGAGAVAKLGAPGDSGAWVIDNHTGRVCGHVLAFSATKQIAYIAPMDVLLHDIQQTLSARQVCLPGQAFAVPERGVATGARITDVEREVPGAAARRGRRNVDEQVMAEELARLRVEDDASPRSQRVLAQHMVMSGAQSHLEREWASRRAALGLECRASG